MASTSLPTSSNPVPNLIQPLTQTNDTPLPGPRAVAGNSSLQTVSTQPPTNPVSKSSSVKRSSIVPSKTTTIGQNQGSLAGYQTQQSLMSTLNNEDETDFYGINLPADADRNKVVKIIIYDSQGNYMTQSNFVITQMQESSREVVQVTQGFEQFMVLFFNPTVSSITFGGLLINDTKYNQYNYFQNLYNSYLKGSVNALNNYIIYIKFFNNQYVRASFVNLEMSINAQSYELIPMSFSVLVLERYFMTVNPSTGQIELIMTLDYQDTALQLQNPNLTQDQKNALIMHIALDMKTTLDGMNVTVIQATPTSLVVSFSNPSTGSGLTAPSNSAGNPAVSSAVKTA